MHYVCIIIHYAGKVNNLLPASAIPGENKPDRLNNQAIPPKNLRKEIFQGAGIQGKDSSQGTAVPASAIPGENKSNRLNNQSIQPKILRKEIFQGAGIEGKNSSPGIAVPALSERKNNLVNVG